MFYDVPAVLKGSVEMEIISLYKAVYSDTLRFNFLPQTDFHVENLNFIWLCEWVSDGCSVVSNSLWPYGL